MFQAKEIKCGKKMEVRQNEALEKFFSVTGIKGKSKAGGAGFFALNGLDSTMIIRRQYKICQLSETVWGVCW